nr:unnamed protein product [Callosobruchus analis]
MSSAENFITWMLAVRVSLSIKPCGNVRLHPPLYSQYKHTNAKR